MNLNLSRANYLATLSAIGLAFDPDQNGRFAANLDLEYDALGG